MRNFHISTISLTLVVFLSSPLLAEEMMANEGQLNALFPEGTPYSP
jgi:hypothetical protein